MAFAPPNEKKRAYQQALTEAAAAESQRLEEVRRHCEPDDETLHADIRMCYQQHIPAQLAQAGKMIQAGKENDEREERLLAAQADGLVCWERLGNSRGGRSKRNLYRCLVS